MAHEVIRTVLADFDNEVAEVMELTDGERTDLWGDIEVPVEALRSLLTSHDAMLTLLKEAADFVQPFNRAADLLDRIESAIAKADA